MLFARTVFEGLKGPYSVVLADPPWAFSGNSIVNPGRNVRRHYPTLPIEALEQLPVQEIVASDALLYMWVTAPMAELAFRVVRAWGFKYKTQLVWQKDRISTGYWVRGRHEPVYLCTRGSFRCPPKAPHPDSIIEAPRREHSRKPELLVDQIDKAFPGHRKVELFARRRRDGWDSWGNDVDKFERVGADSEEAA